MGVVKEALRIVAPFLFPPSRSLAWSALFMGALGLGLKLSGWADWAEVVALVPVYTAFSVGETLEARGFEGKSSPIREVARRFRLLLWPMLFLLLFLGLAAQRVGFVLVIAPFVGTGVLVALLAGRALERGAFWPYSYLAGLAFALPWSFGLVAFYTGLLHGQVQLLLPSFLLAWAGHWAVAPVFVRRAA